MITLVFLVPEAVMNLQYTIADEASANISWMVNYCRNYFICPATIIYMLIMLLLQAPVNVLLPSVTHYNVYHNATSSYEALETNTTSIIVTSAVGSRYSVMVAAQNVIGEGANTSITG